MTLFDPPEEILKKEIDITEATPEQLIKTMGASAYTGDYGKAMEVIEQTEYEVVELQELCERVFRKKRFSRVYVNDEEFGHPYLTPTNFGSLKPWYRQINNTEKGYVSKKKHKLSEYNVEDGWILITCSGSVNLGSVFFATDFMTNFFMTHDMIRVVPKDDTLEGYLYAYLDSWVGRSIMLHNEFRVGIDHIEPEQIEDMPVVLPPQEKRKEIHKTVRGAYAAREEFLRSDKQAVEGLGSLLDDQYEPIEPEDT